jgi:hypothetical protein
VHSDAPKLASASRGGESALLAVLTVEIMRVAIGVERANGRADNRRSNSSLRPSDTTTSFGHAVAETFRQPFQQ